MRQFGDRFDHNLHALHIVERFEQRYARFPGLNLTFEVREGMVKHSRDIKRGEMPEFDEFLPGLKPPLEGQLIDLADEIAYNSADLDDAYSAGFFTLDEIAAGVPHYGELLEEIRQRFPHAPEGLQFQEVLRRLINLLVSGFIEGTRDALAQSGVASIVEVREHATRLASLTPAARAADTGLKRFLLHRVYTSPQLIHEREQATGTIGKLFEFFLTNPGELPEPHTMRWLTCLCTVVVCDYIAGMTDSFCRNTALRLVG